MIVKKIFTQDLRVTIENTFNIDFMNVSLSDMNSLSFDVLKRCKMSMLILR